MQYSIRASGKRVEEYGSGNEPKGVRGTQSEKNEIIAKEGEGRTKAQGVAYGVG